MPVLLDTDIVSEPVRGAFGPAVKAWLASGFRLPSLQWFGLPRRIRGDRHGSRFFWELPRVKGKAHRIKFDRLSSLA